MYRLKQIKLDINHTPKDLENKIAKIINTNNFTYKINKQSLDARKGLKYVYEVDVKTNKKLNMEITPDETYKLPKHGNKSYNKIVIVGSGPAGLFAGYLLAKEGYKPLIIERGEDIDNRIKTVQKFWETNILNENSNVQFGAGGAGTFSDGKLNTNNKDKFYRNKFVLETFVKFKAPKEILYINKPHIGTDLLKEVIKNMIKEIENLGGTIMYNTTLTDLIIKENMIKAIWINNKEIIECDNLVLALGHSSRDTFEMLLKHKINISPKPFAVGVRLQHPQSLINLSQYKKEVDLPPASYKLTHQTSNKRGVYSFCMCPGGYVINASSEKGRLAINGMSNHKRDSENANSAIIVTISPKDFGNNPLDGIKFQRLLEEKAYLNGKIPTQLYKDFKENKTSKNFGSIKPCFKGNYKLTNLRDILPEYISNALLEAIPYFGTKIKGFDGDDTIISAIESRTSSPIKIIRDENFQTNIKGIYPIGEGAGYSGGIMTSATDGIKLAEILIKLYKPIEHHLNK